MRKLCHKIINNIFDFLWICNLIFIHIQNSIICFFKIPKYKLFTDAYCCWGTSSQYKKICKIYKEYKTNTIFYELADGISYSEGLLDFYKEN